MENKLKSVPLVGKFYHFWDDGKCGAGRHYICRIERIIPFTKAKDIILNTPRGEEILDKTGKFESFDIDMSLEDIWKDEVKECDWVFDEETDYFVEASCPVYDDHNLWFARTKDGGWFSMNIQSWWQGGRLDINGEIYEEMIKYCEENGMDPTHYSSTTYEKK